MRHHSAIAIVVALALLGGQTVLPLGRAACGAWKGEAAPACPSCAAGLPASSTLSMSVDRSCCAAPKALAERAPATIGADRSGDNRLPGPSAILPLSDTPAARTLFREARAYPPEPSGSSPPLLRTTILLI